MIGGTLGGSLRASLPLRAAFFAGAAMIAAVADAATYSLRAMLPSGFTHCEILGVLGNTQVGLGWGNDNVTRGLLWNGTAASAVDMTPSGYQHSSLEGIFPTSGGNVEVGGGDYLTGSTIHFPALAWRLTSNAVAFGGSDATALAGSEIPGGLQIAGKVVSSGRDHATLWNGPSESQLQTISLHPSGYNESYATAAGSFAGETVQAGYGDPSAGGGYHALLWHSDASTAVDLQPAGYSTAVVNEVIVWNGGLKEVGFGFTAGLAHALIWSGTALSATDISASGFAESLANGMTSDGTIFGYVRKPATQIDRAAIWDVSTHTPIDLSLLLPSAYNGRDSYVTGIGSNGTVYGWAESTTGPVPFAWDPVAPEPTGIAMLSVALLLGLRLRR
jgi:hypothetical protein